MITIIGAGRVGSAAAMRIACMGIDDVMLIDIAEGVAQGEALDIAHACCSNVKITGSSRFEDMQGSELIINTAGLARKPGMSRLDLMKENKKITEAIGKHIAGFAPNAVVMQVANPVDIMTLFMLRATGFPRERVIGMGSMLDMLRFSYLISKELGGHEELDTMVIGEHGDSMVPLVSYTMVSGKPVKDMLDISKINELVEKTRTAGAEVIALKGSTFHGPSAAVAIMAESIIKDRKKIIPASVFLQGEYGFSGICMGVPVTLGKGGAENIIELELDENERTMLSASAKKIEEGLKND
ncbi:MAG: malate dehydrogenase [Candidatus Aenigmarchaeota archaeon]|nr:malate dehydrogenase [Candidatus Aenigmarchaeota archaeon]